MNQALYRKYRSKSLSEIVGQEHITTALGNAIKAAKISHAYLFTGPKGVGKTSIARILAHEINELPYTDESTHLDIIEIDAASNRRIDEMRDLRDKVHVSPTSAKYKVYIIDEVHMLTKEAFNALLKTLEEPPAHVVFILATTEAHKLPDTIISRTQRYHFTSIDPERVAEHLATIAEKEGFTVDDDALQLIAEHGEGSFRDSISLLDQIASGSDHTITADDVRTTTGHAPAELLEAIIEAVTDKSPTELFTQLEKLKLAGISTKPLTHQLIVRLREHMMSRPSQALLALMQDLLAIESSLQPDIALEITLLRHGLPAETTEAPAVAPAPKEPAKKTSSKPKFEAAAEEARPEVSEPEPESKADVADPKPKPKSAAKSKNSEVRAFSPEQWTAMLSALKSSNPSLYSVIRMAQPVESDGKLELHFRHTFHYKRLKESRNIEIVGKLLEQLLGQPLAIESVYDAAAEPALATAPVGSGSIERAIESDEDSGAGSDDPLAKVMEAFGGGEVVET